MGLSKTMGCGASTITWSGSVRKLYAERQSKETIVINRDVYNWNRFGHPITMWCPEGRRSRLVDKFRRSRRPARVFLLGLHADRLRATKKSLTKSLKLWELPTHPRGESM